MSNLELAVKSQKGISSFIVHFMTQTRVSWITGIVFIMQSLTDKGKFY